MTPVRTSLMAIVSSLSIAGVVQLAQAQQTAPSSVSDRSLARSPLGGVLFFSEEQRAQMNHARLRGSARMPDGGDFIASRSVINGFVRRSDGSVTVWVDGSYKVLSDPRVTERVQATSVGMDSNLVMSSSAQENPVAATKVHKKAPQKKRPVSRTPKSSARK